MRRLQGHERTARWVFLITDVASALLKKKHGGLSVVCSGSLCIFAGRFYPWSLFSYGRNRKEVLY